MPTIDERESRADCNTTLFHCQVDTIGIGQVACDPRKSKSPVRLSKGGHAPRFVTCGRYNIKYISAREPVAPYSVARGSSVLIGCLKPTLLPQQRRKHLRIEAVAEVVGVVHAVACQIAIFFVFQHSRPYLGHVRQRDSRSA